MAQPMSGFFPSANSYQLFQRLKHDFLPAQGQATATTLLEPCQRHCQANARPLDLVTDQFAAVNILLHGGVGEDRIALPRCDQLLGQADAFYFQDYVQGNPILSRHLLNQTSIAVWQPGQNQWHLA